MEWLLRRLFEPLLPSKVDDPDLEYAWRGRWLRASSGSAASGTGRGWLAVCSAAWACGAKSGGGWKSGSADQTVASFSARRCSFPRLGGNFGDGGWQQAASLLSHDGDGSASMVTGVQMQLPEGMLDAKKREGGTDGL